MRHRNCLALEDVYLGDNVVDGGLEGGRGLEGDVIGDLVQRQAHGQLGSNLGNGEAGSLGSQGRRPTHTRVHLDDHDLQPCRGMSDGECPVPLSPCRTPVLHTLSGLHMGFVKA